MSGYNSGRMYFMSSHMVRTEPPAFIGKKLARISRPRTISAQHEPWNLPTCHQTRGRASVFGEEIIPMTSE